MARVSPLRFRLLLRPVAFGAALANARLHPVRHASTAMQRLALPVTVALPPALFLPVASLPSGRGIGRLEPFPSMQQLRNASVPFTVYRPERDGDPLSAAPAQYALLSGRLALGEVV